MAFAGHCRDEGRGKQRVILLMNLFKRIAEHGQIGIRIGHTLISATRFRMWWRVTIAQILKENDTQTDISILMTGYI